MFKKLITISILLILIAGTMPVSFAQRSIDPALKPQNSPATPLTGPAYLDCIKENDKDLYATITKELEGKDEAQQQVVVKKYQDKTAKYWDVNSQLCKGREEEPIVAFIQIFSGALLMLSGGVAVIMVTVAAVMYATSSGKQQQLEFAKNTIMYAIIGMAVIIFSYWIVRTVLDLVIGT